MFDKVTGDNFSAFVKTGKYDFASLPQDPSTDCIADANEFLEIQNGNIECPEHLFGVSVKSGTRFFSDDAIRGDYDIKELQDACDRAIGLKGEIYWPTAIENMGGYFTAYTFYYGAKTLEVYLDNKTVDELIDLSILPRCYRDHYDYSFFTQLKNALQAMRRRAATPGAFATICYADEILLRAIAMIGTDKAEEEYFDMGIMSENFDREWYRKIIGNYLVDMALFNKRYDDLGNCKDYIYLFNHWFGGYYGKITVV